MVHRIWLPICAALALALPSSKAGGGQLAPRSNDDSSEAPGYTDISALTSGDRTPRYEGPGFRGAGPGAQPAVSGGFPAQSVTLMSWLPLADFDSVFIVPLENGNDCWGYVSPSGREYALLGTSEGTAFVEISDPGNPVIVAGLIGPSSLWRDMKVYQNYAYAVSEGGGGIQVIDMAQIDSGLVTLTNTVMDGGTGATHNVAIDEESGFLYRCGGGSNGLRIYNLADPANPVFVASWSERYVHDAQIVTYTQGKYAGRQIAFCCNGFDGGVDILDVSDKGNIINLATYQYSNAAYSHQAWLSPDRNYLYVGDELDEQYFDMTTNTKIIDVTDLQNPFEVGVFGNGNDAIDHNIYTLGSLIFEANYRSGLRIFDASDPVAPVEVAFFDTYPNNDSPSFDGLWSNFPYFPSGTIIGSDMGRGLFVWRLPLCFGGIGNCSGHGQCVDGACQCDAGWSGEDCSCSTDPCPSDCSGHGICVCGVCDCDLGWISEDCSLAGCATNAECTDGDVCTRDECIAGDCFNDTLNTYGDVDRNDSIDIFDLLCVLAGFAGDFSNCSFVDDDIHPCIPNDTINIFDLLAVLGAFAGIDPCCGQ